MTNFPVQENSEFESAAWMRIIIKKQENYLVFDHLTAFFSKQEDILSNFRRCLWRLVSCLGIENSVPSSFRHDRLFCIYENADL